MELWDWVGKLCPIRTEVSDGDRDTGYGKVYYEGFGQHNLHSLGKHVNKTNSPESGSSV